ncbi:TIGR02269 family lipoprotein [Archangium violaceum]|uniref:SitA6 family polymorphic toxin lipoprotein n=1 Tax=Archangium violaceum TaxID=83451 RepID=UPI0037C105BB
MSLLPSWRWLALLGVLLSACSGSAPSVREDDESLEAVTSWEEARADPSCVVPLCDARGCAVWWCRDVAEVDAPPVVLAQAMVPAPAAPAPMLRSPPSVGNPRRWWGRPLAVPTGVDPVFEIPWHNWNIRGQYAPRALRPPCLPSREPFEKHHIFPQEPAAWFKLKEIDIHAFTIRVPKSFHRWLHSGAPGGGQWNEAWRQFQNSNYGTTPEHVWRFAGELMSRFGVNGPLVPYFCG